MGGWLVNGGGAIVLRVSQTYISVYTYIGLLQSDEKNLSCGNVVI